MKTPTSVFVRNRLGGDGGGVVAEVVVAVCDVDVVDADAEPESGGRNSPVSAPPVRFPRVRLTLTMPQALEEPVRLRDGLERILAEYDFSNSAERFSKDHRWSRLMDGIQLGLQVRSHARMCARCVRAPARTAARVAYE